jgi:hypothetical protein
MFKQCVTVLALLSLLSLQAGPALATGTDPYPAWRAAAAATLATRGDAGSLATAAALTFLGPPSRTKTETGKAASAALEFAVKASELAPNNPAVSWMRLLLCMNAPACDIRQAATNLRWVAADNGAAWLPTLTVAQKDKDTVEVDRVLDSMAEGSRFELYGNRSTVLIWSALKRAKSQLPANYLKSEAARLNEAMGTANAIVLPSFSPLINACREAAPDAERRKACLTLSKTLQHADVVMAQLVGFAIEKRLNPGDARELRSIAERRRALEWRVALADRANVTARSRLAKMRAMPREEDVDIAILRELKKSLDPPEDHR